MQHEVNLIRHETETQDTERELGLGRLQQREERCIVGIFMKYDRTTVAPIEYMVGMSSELSTWNARRGASRY